MLSIHTLSALAPSSLKLLRHESGGRSNTQAEAEEKEDEAEAEAQLACPHRKARRAQGRDDEGWEVQVVGLCATVGVSLSGPGTSPSARRDHLEM